MATCGLLWAALLPRTSAVARDPPPATDESNQQLFFEDAIAPLLKRHCVDCHEPDTREAKLDVSTAEALLVGSESGPVVTSGSRKRSLLYEMVHSGEMPRDAQKLSHDEIELIGQWIDSGMPFRNPPASISRPLTQHDVLPILLLRCTTCHGAELKRGELDLRTISGLRQGGASGPAAVSGDPDASRMIQRVEQQLCPPSDQLLKYFVERPSKEEIEKLRGWIAGDMREEELSREVSVGLPDAHVAENAAEHWAFQPLPKTTAVPRFDGVKLAQPIDAFIYQQLQANDLDFSPQARKTEIIRRVYLDLIGIPPTLEELEHWQQHKGRRWYEEMVTVLLDSPKYGERWGRHWLDVAGYADSEGGQAEDPVRDFAWKYRDYVIRAFNNDKPWNRFLHEQLAGDELADYTNPSQVTDEIVDNLIATGFLRMGIDETGSRTMNFVPERLGLISNALTVVGSGVMGMTMECARCHSHKYDPIPQTDYFRLKAIFQGAFDEHDWMSYKTRTLDIETPAAIAQRDEVNGPIGTQLKVLQGRRKLIIAKQQQLCYDVEWPKLSAELQKEIGAALKVKASRRTMRQLELVIRYDSEIRPSEPILVKNHPEVAAELRAIDAQVSELREKLLPEPTIRALWDRGRPSPTYVLIRGEYNRPGRPVGPGVPSVLTDGETPLDVHAPWPGSPSTGRRLAFAKWLTEPDHPLTARVLVNRVWSLHFGRGIVKTLDNFGKQGTLPTHPELLDWLARDFVEHDWSLKSLHRRILLSRTYRQSSAHREDSDRIDPENRLLSRMTLHRLDAEALRDSLLSVSGRLDERMFGPPVPMDVRDDGLILDKPSKTSNFRRSIYLQLRRTEMPTMLSSFDYPEMQPNCSERSVSTVSTQSLILMNNSRVYELAGSFAARILAQSHEPAAIVTTAYRTAFSRDPTASETSAGCEALERLQQLWMQSGVDETTASQRSLANYCHTLLNSAEFTYVD
jgi:mono/diheme cytochrome c family protein